MKAPPISTLLGVAAMLVGGWWIWGFLVEPGARLLSGEKGLQDYLFLFIMVSVISLPGMFAAYFGFRLTREKAPRNYKGLVGVFAVCAVFWLSNQLERSFAAQVHEKLASSLFLFLATMAIIPAYVLLTTWLMRQEGIKVTGVGSVIGKGTVFIVAVQIWGVGSDLFDAYAPIEPGYTYLRKGPWNFLGFDIPLASAYLFYKVANWRLAKSAAKPSDKSHPQGQNELNSSAPA